MTEASMRLLVGGACAAYGLSDDHIRLMTKLTLRTAKTEDEYARFGPGFKAVIRNPAVHFGVPETARGIKQQKRLNWALETVLEDLQQHGPTLSMIGAECIRPVAYYLAILRWQDSGSEKSSKIRQAWLGRAQDIMRNFPLQAMLITMKDAYGRDFTAHPNGDPARLTSQLMQIAGVDMTPDAVAAIWARQLRDAED